MPLEFDVDVSRIASHWTSRCVENGVPLDDYQLITSGIGSWEEWCDAWSAVADERVAQADEAAAAGHTRTAAELRLIAALEYHFGKFLFVHDMPTLKEAHAKACAQYLQAVEDLAWSGSPFDVRVGEATFHGVLRLPSQGGGPHPAVLCVPGLDAAKEELHRFQEVFLARGMATVCIDGPGQGEAEYDHPLRPDWEVFGDAVLAAMADHPDLDGDRLGLVGVSLGGYYAARTAAASTRLRCAASLGGCHNFGVTWDRLPPLTRQAFHVRSRHIADADAAAFARTFDLGAVEPIGGTPFLVVHGSRDMLFGDDQAKAMAHHFGGDGELVIEPHGNHVLHNLAYRVRPATADWVAGHLSVT